MTAQTIQTRILETLKTWVESIEQGRPTSDPAVLTLSEVSRAPYQDYPKTKRAICAILVSSVRRQPGSWPYTEATMQVEFQVHLYRDTGEQAAILVETVLSDIERRVMQDQTIGGLALRTVFGDMTFDLDGVFDNSVTGSVFAEIRYRHTHTDPRSVSAST